jgi:peptidoglycan-associated lipoprotein
MKLCKILLSFLILAGLTGFNIANAQKNVAQDADNAFTYQQYYEAVGMYKKALTKVKKNKAEKARITFQIAECYRMNNDLKQSEVWYKKSIAVKYPDALATLYYADALKANEKYPEAIIQYDAYKALVPADERGAKGSESCTLAQQWKDNPTRYEVENVKQFNGKDADFAASYADKKFKSLIFTSNRDGSTGKELDAWTGLSFMDLYLVAQDRKGAWSTPSVIPEPVNSKFNEGAATLNSKANEIYFTRCGVEKKRQLGCQIYVAKKKGTAWDIPELLPLSPDSFTCGHPSLSDDELTLFFSSDMPGGQGGKDIWMVKRSKKNKPWDQPINLGSTINTAGDEMYPYLRDDGVLFFSSNSLIGMGGLDIFKSEKNGDKWGTPVNLKYPINSAGDDFAIIFEGKLEKGYFSSNRKGGKGNDDIYSFYQPPLIFTLQGKVCDDSTKAMMKGVTVKMIGSDGTVVVDTTDATGTYSFDKAQYLANTSYQLEVSKIDYFGAKGKESTVGLERSKDFIHDFCLTPIPKKPIVLPEILYDYDKWDLKPQYQDSLNGLIQTMEDNPSITIELGSHTDARGSDVYNDSLSFKRAKSVVDYLISKGIAADRMVPFGYGEKTPRTLLKDITRDGYTFTKGTKLTEDYINSFKSDSKKFEAAHQLNRRTEFKILRSDYVPKSEGVNTGVKIGIKTSDESDSTNVQPQENVTPDNNAPVNEQLKEENPTENTTGEATKTNAVQDKKTGTSTKKTTTTKTTTKKK